MNNLEKLYEYYPPLKKINNENRGVIENNVIFKTYNFHQETIEEYNSCAGFMFVVKGKINIFKVNENGEETHLYTIGTGEICHGALSCILFNKPINIKGIALEKTEAFFMPMEILKGYLLKDEIFLKFIYISLHDKFQLLIESMENITHDSVENRLIKAMRKKESNIIYTTHESLAKEIGSSREVVSRKLKSLERAGYLKLERGKIQIIKKLITIKDI